MQKTIRLHLIFVSLLLIYGCAAKPEPSIHTTPFPDTGYGLLSFGFDGHWENNGGDEKPEGLPRVSALVLGKGKSVGVTRARLKERNELKILVVPAGEYRVTDFGYLDGRLTLPNKAKFFTVAENELVYLGKYQFTVFVKNGLFGLAAAGFDFSYTNDLGEVLPLIASRIESTYPGKLKDFPVRFEFPFRETRQRFNQGKGETNPASSESDTIPLND